MIRSNDASELTFPLADEALALSAVLKTTMQSIQVLRREKKAPYREQIQQQKLSYLSQQLEQLHRVGANLSERWRDIEDSNPSITEPFQSLLNEVRNLVSLACVSMETLDRYQDRVEQVYQTRQMQRMRQSIQTLICLLEQTVLTGRSGLIP